MAIIEKFNELSLARQMQILFILSSFTICGILMVITRFQLDWIHSSILEDTKNASSNRINYQIKSLGLLQAQIVELFLENAIIATSTLHGTSKIALGFNNLYKDSPFETGYINSSADFNNESYDHSSYYSKNFLSHKGKELLNNQSSLNSIFPIYYNSLFTVEAQGFEIDEIVVIYPGQAVKEGYSPTVQEWYYKAKMNSSHPIITEPFFVIALKNWCLTTSQALLDLGEKFYGVASITFTLNSLVQLIEKVKVYGNGFSLLVSKTGILFNYPEAWKKMKEDKKTLRAFDEKITGINQDGWNFIQNAENGDHDDIVDGQDVSYRFFVFKISPSSVGEVTHYLLIYVRNEEINKSHESSKRELEKTNSIIFWLTFAFAILTFFIILVLIHVFFLKCGWTLQDITIAIQSIIERALFYRITKSVKLSNKSLDEMKDIISLFDKKVKNLKVREEELMTSSQLVGVRIKEELIYNKWNENAYPFNFYHEKSHSVRYSLKRLKSFPISHWNTVPS